MKTFLLLTMAAITLVSVPFNTLQADQTSAFDEAAIRAIQESRSGPGQIPQGFQTLVEEMGASNDPLVKASKHEQLIIAASEGMLTGTWPEPSGGWKLLEWPQGSNLTVEDVRSQQGSKVLYTKVIAQNATEAVRLRGAQGLMLNAALEGEQWGEKLLLDIAQRPDSNIKRLAYWFAHDFAQDWHTQGESATDAPVWPVNWNAWQQAYNAADTLGKAIILRNVTMLAVRRNEFVVASAINLSALSGTDRELKANPRSHGEK